MGSDKIRPDHQDADLSCPYRSAFIWEENGEIGGEKVWQDFKGPCPTITCFLPITSRQLPEKDSN